MSELFDHVPVSATAKEAVIRRLQEPHRRYHNLEHVLEMWRWHCEYSRGRCSDALVASFCLYHDAIYDPCVQGNERRSAELWLMDSGEESQMAGTGTRLVTLERVQVYDAIMGSADHFKVQREPCVDWCLNLDLMRLGTPNHEFVQHGLDIRAEYQHLSERQWVKASSEFRARVMAQSAIFRFTELAAFEAQARYNLSKALTEDWQTLGYTKETSGTGP
jgi:predicted metal-dependent HD superfamily phosphohydrolase